MKIHVKGVKINMNKILCKSNNLQNSFSLFSPLQVQTFSFLLEFLHEKLDIFADNIVFVSKMPAFRYLSVVGFPALFGFFSNEDLCLTAAKFYIKVSKLLQPDLFKEFVSPFFATDVVSVFSDIVFKNFFMKNTMKRLITKDQTRKIFSICEKNLKFLPETHLMLIRHLLKTWGKNQTWQLIASAILIPQLKIQILEFPYARARDIVIFQEKLIETIERTAKDSNICDISPASIAQSMSSGIPSPVHEGEPFSQATILTLFDLRILLSLPVIFPAHLQCVNELLSDDENQAIPFFAKFFIEKIIPLQEIPLFFPPKERRITESDPELSRKWSKIRSQLQDPVNFLIFFNVNENMNFPNALAKVAFKGERGKDLVKFGIEKEIERYEKACECFEKMLTYRIILDSMYIWKARSLKYTGIISRIIAFKNYMSRKGELPSVADTNFWINVLFLSDREHQYTAPYQQQLLEQEKAFYKLIDSLKVKFITGLGPLSDSANLCVLKLSALMSLVNESSTLYDRYVVITSFMEKAFELSTGMLNHKSRSESTTLVIHYFIVIYDAIWMYRTAVFMQKFLFGSQNAVICPFEVLEQWNHFFTAFLNLISTDEKLLSDFTQISIS